MADIEKRKAELAAETPEEKAAREKLRAELAAEALGLGKSIKDSEQEADEKGRDGLSPSRDADAEGSMTVENYDVDVTKYDDKALGNKLNLSSLMPSLGGVQEQQGRQVARAVLHRGERRQV